MKYCDVTEDGVKEVGLARYVVLYLKTRYFFFRAALLRTVLRLCGYGVLEAVTGCKNSAREYFHRK